MSPVVSIGLPVYNGEMFLEESLSSLLAQDFEDFELIISDNASTDATESMCRAMAGRDRRVRYYRCDRNLGAARNYNRVFHLAEGRYFKWTADDDPCHERFLSACVEALDRDPGAVLCYPKTIVVDGRGEVIPTAERELDLNTEDTVLRFSRCLSPMGIFRNPVFGLVRRGALARTRLIGAYLASDRCLIAELSLLGRFLELPDRLLYRRKHDRNVGTRASDMPFYDPRVRVRVVFPEWRVLKEHLATVARASLPVNLKFRSARAVLKWALQRRCELCWQMKSGVARLGKRAVLSVPWLRRSGRCAKATGQAGP